MNFIIQKLKSNHTSLKKYTNWAKLVYFSLVLREWEEKKPKYFAPKPQLSFNQSLDNLPFWSKLFGPKENIQAGAEVGKANGLTVLIDAETYDYTYHLRAGEGFKVTIYYIQGGPSMMFLSDT